MSQRFPEAISNSMNRFRVKVFSALAAFAVGVSLLLPAAAQDAVNTNFWFGGTRLIFERAVPLDGDVAVSIRDSGFARFIGKLGATVAYQPQQRYVVITAADRRTITFTVGSAALASRDLDGDGRSDVVSATSAALRVLLSRCPVAP